MTDEHPVRPDPYSRVDYRRMVAWPERIRREWPFLERLLLAAPSKRVVDLGCGTGEHARFFASQGFEVVAIDASPSMLEKARESAVPAGVTFIEGDIANVATLCEGSFGAAICLGNTLPHLHTADVLARLTRGLASRLLPGGLFIVQILNYDKILTTGQQVLPVNVRRGEGEHVVFLRLMDPRPDGMVIFTPSTLRYRPDSDPPLEVVVSRNVLLRGWTRADLEPLLDKAGFVDRRLYGTVGDEPYLPAESSDLVIVARLRQT